MEVLADIILELKTPQKVDKVDTDVEVEQAHVAIQQDLMVEEAVMV
jgi:hypothetical protein